MDQLIVEATSKTPEVKFSKEGNLFMQGNSLPENSAAFYNPLIDWISQNIEPEQKVDFDIRLQFLNTSSSKQIYRLISYIADKVEAKNVSVKWHYEEDDEDMLEAGQHYQSLIHNVDFKFIEFY